MLKQQIEQDLKTALLAGDKARVMTLRSLKSAILYVEVAQGNRDKGLADDEILYVLAKESKKRQESAGLYRQGGSIERAEAEEAERLIIDAYLPQQLSDDELKAIVEDVVAIEQPAGPQAMGKIIGAVKAKAGSNADGSRIAALVKERLSR